MNERIRAREVRVIDDESGQLGIMPPFEAIKKARERGLDLVEISPNAVPPVCKIMDYGKFLYEQEKKERAAKKKQKVITVKEVKFSINVDDHDYETKKNHVLRFRGREMAHRNLGRDMIDRLIRDVSEKAIVEFAPRMEGNTMHAILAPKKAEVASKPPRAPAPQQPRP